MRIRTECEIPCTIEDAWRAMHTPSVATELYDPVLQMSADGGFPERFSSGDRRTVRLALFGRVVIGTQLVHIEDDIPDHDRLGVRTMRDRGRPLSGPLVLLTRWQHQMTVLPSRQHPGLATWRDELSIGGAAAVVFGPCLSVMWWVRKRKIRRLALRWGYPEQ